MLHHQFGKRKAAKKINQQPIHVRKGDTVMVISGKDRGKTGTVKQVLTKKNKILVDGLNMVKKAVRPNPQFGIRGGITEMEAALHVSKVMVYDLKAKKPTRVRKEEVKGADGTVQRVRVSKQSGEHLDD